MPSNFDFLENHWQHLQPDATEVETNAFKSPRTAVFYARRALEQVLKWLYENDTALKMPYEQNLASMLYAPTFKNNIKPALHNQLKFIHRIGNLAVHDDAPISPKEGLQITTALHCFLGWLARVCCLGRHFRALELSRPPGCERRGPRNSRQSSGSNGQPEL